MYRRLYASHAGRAAASAARRARHARGGSRSTASRGSRSPAGAAEEYGLKSEDLDGIVEHPRSIAGTRLALFFRDLGHGKVKVSFRSTGDVDVNAFARQFGGGGHARAAGALIAGSIDGVRHDVVAAARDFLRATDAAKPRRTPRHSPKIDR